MTKDFSKVFTGGCKVGRTYSTWPFAKFVVEPSHLALVAPFKKEYHFLATDDVIICPYKHVLFRVPNGIQIKHHKSEYPDRIIFWSFKTKPLLESLKSTNFALKIQFE